MTWEEWIERLLQKIFDLKDKKADIVILLGRPDPKTGQPRVEVREHGL